MKIRSVLILAGVVLLAAVALQVYGAIRLEPEAARVALKALVPAELAGWTMREGQVAETQEMKRAVGELLNYDDVVLRSYRRGGIEFEIYAAYWRPGKMSHRLIAGHTPDVCWVAAGWTMAERGADALSSARGDAMTQRAEQRVFKDTRGVPRYVRFWHLSGGEPVSYDVAGTPPWWAVFSDFKRFGLNQRRSQYFVRVSTNVPFAELDGDAGFRAAMAAIKPVIVASARQASFPAKRLLSYWHSQDEHWRMHPDWAIKNAVKVDRDQRSDGRAILCCTDAEEALGARISNTSYVVYELGTAPIQILTFDVKEEWKEGGWHKCYDGSLVFYVDRDSGEIVSGHGGSN